MALTKEQIKEFENEEKEAASFYDFYSLARQMEINPIVSL